MKNGTICTFCGGTYEYKYGKWICAYCGQPKPEELGNAEQNLLDVAGQKLRLQDFEEAETLFADLVQKYPRNPDAYWGLVCAKYGIKYEEDFNGKRIPTCCMDTIPSFGDDANYKKALRYASDEQKKWYKSQADYVDRVSKQWVQDAQKEEPYDIFICFKDSDKERGIERTKDSYDAAEIYSKLRDKGYRVFFSRASLADKTGEKYEPYIFQALQTAKVMIVFGSKTEYIQSSWVRNEWQRYMKRIERGEKRKDSILVVGNGINFGDLPSELAKRQHLQFKSNDFTYQLYAYVDKILKGKSAEKHTHAFVTTKVIQATCQKEGCTMQKCACGEERIIDKKPRTQHNFRVKKTIDATCTEAGKRVLVCSTCEEKTEEKIPAKGHDMGDWKIDDVEKERTCKICGYTEKKRSVAGYMSNINWIVLILSVLFQIAGIVCWACCQTLRYHYTVAAPVLLIFAAIFGIIGIILSLIEDDAFSLAYIPIAIVSIILVIASSVQTWKKTETADLLEDGIYYIDCGEYYAVADLEKHDRYGITDIITIPSEVNGKPVKSIASYVFEDCETVILPDSITSISDKAFDSDKDSHGKFLQYLTAPICAFGAISGQQIKEAYITSGTTINDTLLSAQTAIISVSIDDSICYVDADAFKDSTVPYNVYDNARYLGNETNPYFVLVSAKSTDIESIKIHENTKVIASEAFKGCTKLNNIVIPEKVEYINGRAFDGCSRLLNISINKNVKEIGSSAFRGTKLNSVSVHPQNSTYTVVDSCLIEKETQTLLWGNASSTIPTDGTVTVIAENAFYGCTGLEEVTVSASVTVIGEMAFGGCTDLQEFSVDEDNRYYKVVQNCLIDSESLTMIWGNQYSTIPNDGSVASIDANAFTGCNLTSIRYAGTKAEWYYTIQQDTGIQKVVCSDGTITLSWD